VRIGSLLITVTVAGLVAGCSSDEPGADPAPTPSTSTSSSSPAKGLTADSARVALEVVGSPQDGEFDGGRFDYDRPLLRGQLAADGHLSAVSWDVYVSLDDGQAGAWGAGMDVWESPRAARSAAEREAGFLSCDGPRRPVALPDTGDRLLVATSCRKPGFDGFRATASASDGLVSRNLTVSARTRALTERGLVAAWVSLSDTSAEVVAALP
jgi:hypothetical protein